jgi:hypothetical protein
MSILLRFVDGVNQPSRGSLAVLRMDATVATVSVGPLLGADDGDEG